MGEVSRSHTTESDTRLADPIDKKDYWFSYMRQLKTWARDQPPELPPLDHILQSVLLENLRDVNDHLARLSPPGIVTKQHIIKKPTPALWVAFDRGLLNRAHRHGHMPWVPESKYTAPKPKNLAEEWRKAAFYRYDFDRFIPHDGKYACHYDQVHHIWPETLGGKTEPWNLFPLDPFFHLYVLHRQFLLEVVAAPIGTRFVLV